MSQKSKIKESHYRLCLREFKFAATITAAYILICCLICAVLGYGKSPEEISAIAGIPTWALFGVVIPWTLMVAITVFYGFFIMKGDEEI